MDQAKLLFLYFLRSSAAFASEPVISNTHAAAATRSSSIIGSGGLSLWKSPLVDAATAAAAAHQSMCNQRTRHAPPPPSTTACAAHSHPRFVEESSSSQLEERGRIPSNENANSKSSSSSTNVAMKGKITLRFARRSDIQSIHECNIITLPENYNTEFYQRHMRQWPDLALVAEHSPNEEEDDDKDGSSTRTPFINPLGNYEPSTADSSSRQIIGYVIGKVEQIPISPKIEYDSNGMMIDNQGRWGSLGLRNSLPSRVQVGNDSGFSARSSPPPQQRQKQYELMGHITSIAILKDYRRNGLAAELMDQLHYEMRERYHAEAVSLHVRISNNAATRLYGKSMGYQVDHISHSYYADGEDAYYMKKPLGLPSSSPRYCLEQDEYYTDQSQQQQQVLQEGFTTQEEQQQSSQRRRNRLRFPRFNSNNNNDRNQFNMLPDQSVLKNKFELPRTVLNFDEKKQQQQQRSQPQPQLESHYNYNNSSMVMEPRAASIP